MVSYFCQYMSVHVGPGVLFFFFFFFFFYYYYLFYFGYPFGLAYFLGKKLSFWLSACSVLIVVPCLKCVLLSLLCLGRKVFGNFIDSW